MVKDHPFKWRHFKGEIILLCVRWYLRYSLSYRDLEEMMLEWGLTVDHSTIYRWVQRYAPELEKRCKPHLKPTNDSYRVNETYIKVKGQWKYLYRAVDSAGNTIEFMLSARRDAKAAKRFSKKVLNAFHSAKSRVINVDKTAAYPPAVSELKKENVLSGSCELRQIKYLNNIFGPLRPNEWRLIMVLQAFHTETPDSAAIRKLAESIDTFFEKCPIKIMETGLFEFTAASRKDWTQAYEGVMTIILRIIESGDVLGFAELAGVGRNRDWAHFLTIEADRHRRRGVTAEMFLANFKCIIHSIEEIVHELDEPLEVKYDTFRSVRKLFDAMECCIIGDWTQELKDDILIDFQEANRRLTMEKNKYANIFENTSDIVLVADPAGMIVECNTAAREQFPNVPIIGAPFWKLLSMEGENIDEVLKYYPMDQTYELPFDDDSYFVLKISKLTKISMVDLGYMLILNNVSCFVDKRERLESMVWQRTADLIKSENRFRSLFQAAGEGILLVDEELWVVEANERVCRIFECERDELVGLHCRDLTAAEHDQTLGDSAERFEPDRIWCGELTGIRRGGDSFPMEITVKALDMHNRNFFHIIVRDVTKQKQMEESLLHEKSRLEEMNVTLRNVMNAIGREKKDLENAIDKKIRSVLLPALKRVRKEPQKQMRDNYLDIIQDQLVTLTHDFASNYDSRLLKLTRTEIQVCQYIQAGYQSKDIADAMNISFETIQTHRKNIRRKLGLKGRGVNLYTFLAKRSMAA